MTKAELEKEVDQLIAKVEAQRKEHEDFWRAVAERIIQVSEDYGFCSPPLGTLSEQGLLPVEKAVITIEVDVTYGFNYEAENKLLQTDQIYRLQRVLQDYGPDDGEMTIKVVKAE